MSILVWILVVVFVVPTVLGLLYGLVRILLFPVWLVTSGRRRNQAPPSSSESPSWEDRR